VPHHTFLPQEMKLQGSFVGATANELERIFTLKGNALHKQKKDILDQET
jgi:hypothetical protein